MNELFEFLNKIRTCFSDKRRFAILQNMLQHLAEESYFENHVSGLCCIVKAQDYFQNQTLCEKDIASLEKLLVKPLQLNTFGFKFPKEQSELDLLWKNIKFFVTMWNNDTTEQTSNVSLPAPRGCPVGAVGVRGVEGAPGPFSSFESVKEPEETCCVCLDQRPTTMSEDCKHKVLCLSCTAKLSESKKEFHCPVCRVKINTLITRF